MRPRSSIGSRYSRPRRSPRCRQRPDPQWPVPVPTVPIDSPARTRSPTRDQGVDRLVGRAQVAVVDRDHTAPGKRPDERHPTIPGGADPLLPAWSAGPPRGARAATAAPGGRTWRTTVTGVIGGRQRSSSCSAAGVRCPAAAAAAATRVTGIGRRAMGPPCANAGQLDRGRASDLWMTTRGGISARSRVRRRLGARILRDPNSHALSTYGWSERSASAARPAGGIRTTADRWS